MIYATAFLIFCAISSLQLARSFASESHGSYLLNGLAVFAALFLLRFPIQKLLARTSSLMRWWLTAALLVLVAVCLGIDSTTSALALAGEERLLVGLIALACVLWLFQSDVVPMRAAALASLAAAFLPLPNIPESYRLALLASTAAGAAAWLASVRPFVSKPATRLHKSDLWSKLYASLAVLLVVASVLAAQVVLRPKGDLNPWYASWSPSSGGQQAGSDTARRGTGDGPDEITGQSADSVGFDQSDTFSESSRDGLYDLWLESYGAPVPPPQSPDERQKKTLGLKPQNIRIVKSQDQENLSVGQQFELNRQKNPSPPKPQTDRPDVAAEARAWVRGPLPAYLPLAAFETFDGQAWLTVEPGKPFTPVRPDPTRPGWMEILNRPISPSFGQPLTHQLRIGNLGGDVLPMPTLVERFQMGRITRPDFFSGTRAGFIRLAHRNIPPGATLTVSSSQIDPAKLVHVEPALPIHSDNALLHVHDPNQAVSALAAQWASGQPRGWRQIHQVLEQLRSHVTHDPAAQSHPSADPVQDMLFGSRRGPDYRIATSAVMLLRSLGYSTRLVSGFYADETHAKDSSDYVPLNAQNVHFWIELCLADGTWVTLDPTPGYPLLNLPKTLADWSQELWLATLQTSKKYAAPLSLLLIFSVSLFIFRHRLIDLLATAWCKYKGCHPLHVLRVLELRTKLLGKPRPPSLTVARWLGQSLPPFPTQPDFVSLLNRCLYDARFQWNRQDPTHIAARQTLDTLTLNKIRQQYQKDSQP